MMHRSQWIAVAVVLLLLVDAGFAPAKEKRTKEAARAAIPASPKAELPADLNAASLRVQALDTLYQLDLSVPQLKALRTAAAGCADPQKRTAAPDNPKIADALSQFAAVLITGTDDDAIAKLRNASDDLTGDDSAKLDDDVAATPAARPRAAEFAKHLNAGQVAAYLASHADRINDPAEMMLSTLLSLHDADEAADPDAQLRDASEDVGWLVADDAQKAEAAAGRVRDWFKANRDLTADQAAAKHDTLEASAKKAVGDVSPMDVIGHWMNNEVAELMANPQLPPAVDAVLAAKEH